METARIEHARVNVLAMNGTLSDIDSSGDDAHRARARIPAHSVLVSLGDVELHARATPVAAMATSMRAAITRDESSSCRSCILRFDAV